MSIEDIRNLLNKKEKEELNSEDEKRISTLKILLKDDDIFFKIDAETACGILNFLGIQNDEKVVETYFSLISFKEYKKNQGYIINNENNKEER